MILKYKIANKVVIMNPLYEPLLSQSKDYLCEKEEAMFDLTFTKQYFDNYCKDFPMLSIGECEYMLYGSRFYNYLISNNGILLHASCVVYRGYAYLFSAPSGTGKSTHTSLWLKHFKDAKILNDDKPALVFEDDKLYAYGTPFSGKTNLNINEKYPVKAIIFIERSITNEIFRMNNNDAIYNILSQTLRPSEKSEMVNLLSMIDKIISSTRIYKLKCNITEEAVEVFYNKTNED